MAKQVLLSSCGTCGAGKPAEEFSLTPSGNPRGTCKECRNAAVKRPAKGGNCVQCGQTFLKPRSDSRFCTQRCYGESRRRLLGAQSRKPFVGSEKGCTRCGAVKPVMEFSVRRSWGEDRPSSWCRQCVSDDSRKRYAGRQLDRGPRGVPAPVGATHILNHGGYVITKAPGHHRAGRNGWVLQHILVAEEKYGFPITREFTVHHVNNDPADNRPENLELRIGNHGVHGDLVPTILRVPEFREIARRILAQYDD